MNTIKQNLTKYNRHILNTLQIFEKWKRHQSVKEVAKMTKFTDIVSKIIVLRQHCKKVKNMVMI